MMASAAASRVSACASLVSYPARSRIRPGQSARATNGAAAAMTGSLRSPSLSIALRAAASEAANGIATSIARIRVAAAAASALEPVSNPTA